MSNSELVQHLVILILQKLHVGKHCTLSAESTSASMGRHLNETASVIPLQNCKDVMLICAKHSSMVMS